MFKNLIFIDATQKIFEKFSDFHKNFIFGQYYCRTLKNQFFIDASQKIFEKLCNFPKNLIFKQYYCRTLSGPSSGKNINEKKYKVKSICFIS